MGIFFGILPCLLLAWLILIRPRTGQTALLELQKHRYAHRGYHDKPSIPENSMAAFRRAAENGFAAELDIHLTKDGRLAVVHDSDLMRVTGQAGIVEDLTSRELSAYRLEDTQEQIPYLEDVLALFQDRQPLLIELKVYRGNQDALCQAAAALLDRYTGQFCLESFQPQAVLWLKRNRPNWIRGQLVCNLRRAGESRGPVQNLIFSNLLLNALTRPDFIAYEYVDRKNLSNRLCRWLYHPAEFNWTIRSLPDAQAVEADGRTIIFEQFDPREISA